MASESSFGLISLSIMLVLTLYAIGGGFMEAKHFHLLHETGLGIIMGVIVGGFFSFFSTNAAYLFEFNHEFFFLILLPVIIYSGGYNLNKRRFFQNFLYIVLFGLFGTILSFIFICLFTILVNNLGWVIHNNEHIKFNMYQMMIFAATICATDSVAALTMIKADLYPKLFSVVFGEGMVNDAVSIIIFVAVGQLTNQEGQLEGFQQFLLIYKRVHIHGQFLKEFVGSIGIGAAIGLFGTFLFKSLRFIYNSCVLETGIILYIGYLSFTICDILELSGVISVLVTGIILAHYNTYNLSSIGETTTKVTLQTMSLLCESFIYIYLGLSIWSLRQYTSYNSETKETTTVPGLPYSIYFVLAELVICFLSRGLSMAILSSITILIKGKSKWRLTIWDLSIIWFAGLIRGSIAYALIQSVEASNSDDIESVDILKTTILILVVGTTIVLGGMMPFYIKINLRFEGKKSQSLHQSMHQSTYRETIAMDSITGESESSKKYRSKFQRLIRRLDENYLKPWFIYDYLNRKDQIKMGKKLAKQIGVNDVGQGRMTYVKSRVVDPRLTGKQSFQSVIKDAHSESIRDSRQSGAPMRQTTKLQVVGVLPSKYGGVQPIVMEYDVLPVEIPEENENYNFDSNYDSNFNTLKKVEDGSQNTNQQNSNEERRLQEISIAEIKRNSYEESPYKKLE